MSESDLADAARKIEAGKAVWAAFGQDSAKKHQESGNQEQKENAASHYN